MIKVIDTHAHLDHVDNIEEALSQADQLGVTGVVAVSIDLAANKKNLEIKKKITAPSIYVALGMHPESLENTDQQAIDDCFKFVKEHIKEAVAVGEIGLDYWYKWARKNDEKKKLQREVFERYLNLAKESNLPAIIHSRGSWRDCLDIAKSIGVKKANFHWYSGPGDILDEIVSCGFFVSASPALSYSPQHQDAIRRAPIENTLIETDSPVFYSEGEGGFAATPKDVLRTLKLYAAIKNLSEEKVAQALYQNSKDFFDIKE